MSSFAIFFLLGLQSKICVGKRFRKRRVLLNTTTNQSGWGGGGAETITNGYMYKGHVRNTPREISNSKFSQYVNITGPKDSFELYIATVEV